MLLSAIDRPRVCSAGAVTTRLVTLAPIRAVRSAADRTSEPPAARVTVAAAVS